MEEQIVEIKEILDSIIESQDELIKFLEEKNNEAEQRLKELFKS